MLHSSAWSRLTAALAQATVMLRPTEAAVFGMARTIAVPGGNRRAMLSRVRPAAMESTTLFSPTIGSISGMSFGKRSGFTATTITEGGAGRSGAVPAAIA